MIANTPSPISYANPNMPQTVLNEDLIIQEFPLDIRPEKVRLSPATELFRTTQLPGFKKTD